MILDVAWGRGLSRDEICSFAGLNHLPQFLPHPLLELRRSKHLRFAAPAQHLSGDLFQPGQVRLKIDHNAVGLDLPNGLSGVPLALTGHAGSIPFKADVHLLLALLLSRIAPHAKATPR